MKKLIAFAIGAALSLSAAAGPAITLPPGPMYMKFNGNEQIAVGGATTYRDATHSGEISWGVFTVSTLTKGSVSTPHDTIDSRTGPANTIFTDGFNNGQITGMFYDLKAGVPNANNPFPATGGFIDLYWRDLSQFGATDNSELGPNIRCGWNCAEGYTQGTFLARLKFSSGIDPLNPTNHIAGGTIPTQGGFTGEATSFAEVDTSVKGLWTNALNSDWFNTNFGTRDLRFKNSYEQNIDWNGGPGVLGARLDDPAQAVALPEPGAMSLMGLAMVGMGAALRRRQKR